MFKSLDKKYKLKDLYIGTIMKCVGTQSYGTCFWDSGTTISFTKVCYGIFIKQEYHKFEQISTGIKYEESDCCTKKGDFFVENHGPLLNYIPDPYAYFKDLSKAKLTKKQIIELERKQNEKFIQNNKERDK